MRSQSLAKPTQGSTALTTPTPAQLGAVMDGLEHTWSENALLVQQRLYHAIERDDHNAASKWALAGAIATDKLLVLKGRPTEIIGHLHAHRHDHGAIMDKLARALNVSVTHDVSATVKEPALLPAREPVASSRSVSMTPRVIIGTSVGEHAAAPGPANVPVTS